MKRVLGLLLLLLPAALAQPDALSEACQRQGLENRRVDFNTFGTFDLENRCPGPHVIEASGVLIARDGRATQGMVMVDENDKHHHTKAVQVTSQGGSERVEYRFTPINLPEAPEGLLGEVAERMEGTVSTGGCEYLASTCLTLMGTTLLGAGYTAGVISAAAGAGSAALTSLVGVALVGGTLLVLAGAVAAAIIGPAATEELNRLGGQLAEAVGAFFEAIGQAIESVVRAVAEAVESFMNWLTGNEQANTQTSTGDPNSSGSGSGSNTGSSEGEESGDSQENTGGAGGSGSTESGGGNAPAPENPPNPSNSEEPPPNPGWNP